MSLAYRFLSLLVGYHQPALRHSHRIARHLACLCRRDFFEASTYFQAFLGLVVGMSVAGLGVQHVSLVAYLSFHLLSPGWLPVAATKTTLSQDDSSLVSTTEGRILLVSNKHGIERRR